MVDARNIIDADDIDNFVTTGLKCMRQLINLSLEIYTIIRGTGEREGERGYGKEKGREREREKEGEREGGGRGRESLFTYCRTLLTRSNTHYQ